LDSQSQQLLQQAHQTPPPPAARSSAITATASCSLVRHQTAPARTAPPPAVHSSSITAAAAETERPRAVRIARRPYRCRCSPILSARASHGQARPGR
jgi:hypothetical protein